MCLLRILTICAILFASISMSGGHAAMATPVTAAGEHHAKAGADPAGHCADLPGNDERAAGRSIDCMIACAGLPAVGTAIAAGLALEASRSPLPLQSPIAGVLPEMEPPPPRSL